MSKARAMAGFTLVETLIALSVFALIALGGTALLNITLSSQEGLDAAADQTRALQRLQAVLRADIGQMVERSTRSQDGNFETPGLQTKRGTLLQFASLGSLEDPGHPAPRLQKIRYWLQDGTLYRAAFPHVDGAAPPRPVALLEAVTSARVASFARGRWAALPGGAKAAGVPQALEITLEHEQLGRIALRFLTPGQTALPVTVL